MKDDMMDIFEPMGKMYKKPTKKKGSKKSKKNRRTKSGWAF